MNCREARQHWNLYHDSEGDAELHFRISEHLAVCSECAEWFRLQSRFEGLLSTKLAETKSESAVWQAALAASGLGKPTLRPRRQWMAGVAVTVMAALLLLLWLNLFRPVPSGLDLAEVSANWHERLQSGQEPLEFTSNSDQEVESYLKGRVPFPVRCPPRKDAGFAVRGAGVSDVEGRPAAYLNGTVGHVPVSILVLPRDSLAAFPVQYAALRQHGIMHAPAGGYAMVLREFDQNAIVVVGRTDPGVLERVVNAYGSYPDHP